MKSNGTIYWYGLNSSPLLETDLSNNLKYAYFFFNGQRIARDQPDNEVDWYFTDELGNTRCLRIYNAGWPTNESDYYPFGGERVIYSGTFTPYKFTGKERDPESNLDNFGARYMSSQMGRFMSADWSGEPEGVPYANFTDPQTLNLYSYVRNNPVTKADLDGHCYPWCTMALGAGIGALTGAVAETGGELLKGESLSGKSIAKAAVAGAITGAIIGLAGPEAGIATKAALSITGTVIGGATERKLNGEKVLDGKAIATDAAAGLFGAGVESQAERSIASKAVGVTTSTVIETGVDAARRSSGETPAQPNEHQQSQVPSTTCVPIGSSTGGDVCTSN
ncbi:MAG: RHS repeat-associated core domain-containing protein [Candidatus Acidiferrales bacterium]